MAVLAAFAFAALGAGATVTPAGAQSIPQCEDGRDNDGDGLADYGSDPGCSDWVDNEEYNAPPPPPPAQCADGGDNDGDGHVDFPNDPGCSSTGDNDEYNAPPPPPPQLPKCENTVDDDGDGLVDYPNDPGCLDGADNDEYNSPPPPPPPPKQCSDGVDNDGDTKVDYPTDPGCSSTADNDEYNAPTGVPRCENGYDDDGDGLIDYPSDPGCSGWTDNDEYNAPPPSNPHCNDGWDNDGDGKVDYPSDPGCYGYSDTDEGDPAQCGDGTDNDGDGRVDYPSDTGCYATWDTTENSEGGGAPPPAPGDRDGDGVVDGADNCPDYYSPNNKCDAEPAAGDSEEASSPLFRSGGLGLQNCNDYWRSRRSKNLLGQTLVRLRVEIHWCWNSVNITEVNVRTIPEIVWFCCWFDKGVVQYDVRNTNQDEKFYRNWGKPSLNVFAQHRFELCLPKGVGCAQQVQPWVEITVNRGGGVSGVGGGT
jgi:hypothetical protein